MFTAYTSYQHRQLFAGEVRIFVCQIRQIPDLHGSVKKSFMMLDYDWWFPIVQLTIFIDARLLLIITFIKYWRCLHKSLMLQLTSIFDGMRPPPAPHAVPRGVGVAQGVWNPAKPEVFTRDTALTNQTGDVGPKWRFIV